MAVLTDKQMDKHIKERNFAKVYLIYGEEQMYVKKYTDKLVTAVAGKTPSEFNFHSFGDSINFATNFFFQILAKWRFNRLAKQTLSL